MAEQNLDVKVTESGTAVVTSELSKLAGQLDKVTAAQEKETAAATRAAAASEKTAAGVEAFLKAQESKFAVVDRLAGLMGKINLALELVNKAYQLGRTLVEDYIIKMKSLAPVLDTVNAKLTTQAGILDGMLKARNKFAAAGATAAEAAQAAGLQGTITTAEAEAQRLLAERERVIARQNSPVEIEPERQSKLAKSAFQGKMRRLPVQEVIEAVDVAGTRTLADIDAEYAAVQSRALAAKRAIEDLDKAVQERNARPDGTGKKPLRGAGGPTGPETLSGVDQVQAGTEAFTGIPEQMQALAESTSLAIEQIDTLAESYAAAAEQGAAFAEATGKAALASAAAALVAGESVAAALQTTLEAKAVEASVEALWAFGKGLFYSVTDPTLAGPYFASAGYFAATAAAAGVGSALAGAAAGGGGGGARGGAPTERDIGPRRQTGADAGGPTTINVQIDGLSLSTAGQVGEAFLGAMERLRNTPGQRARLERVMTGGNR